MSTSIDSVTINAVEDKRLVQSNAQWAAKLADGFTNWTNLRVGLRWAMDDTGANITGTPRGYWGIMANPTAGVTNGMLSPSVSNFRGIGHGGTSMTRGTSPIVHYFFSTLNLNWHGTTGDFTSIGNQYISASPSTVRTLLLLDYVRSGSNVTCTICYVGGANGLVDVSLATLKEAMVISPFTDVDDYLNSVIGGSGTRYVVSGADSKNANEGTYGELNSIHLAWNRTTGLHRYSDVVFAKLS